MNKGSLCGGCEARRKRTCVYAVSGLEHRVMLKCVCVMNARDAILNLEGVYLILRLLKDLLSRSGFLVKIRVD